MRIITGSAKGTTLKAPSGLGTRPTADRVKESLFSILGSLVIDAMVLDLFAGTGNLGLEALSRGAKRGIFIDESANSVAIIRENALRTKLMDQVAIYRNDVCKGLDKMIQSGQVFNLIFCDPPYNHALVEPVLQKIDQNHILEPGGIITVEYSRHEAITWELKKLNIKRTERYGETLITFLSTR